MINISNERRDKKEEGTIPGCNEQSLEVMEKMKLTEEKSKIVECLHNANSGIQLWYLVIDKS